MSGPTTPTQLVCWFGLFPVRSPLLGEYSLFLWVLRCFSSPGSLRYPIYSDNDTVGSQQWVTPFGNPRLNRLFAAHRGLSQRPASFFGTWRLGIHRKPLVASACDTENSILFHAFSSNVFTVTSFDALAYNTILLVRFYTSRNFLALSGSHVPVSAIQHQSIPILFLTHTATRARRQVAVTDPVRFRSLPSICCCALQILLLSFLPASTFTSGGDEGTRTPGPRLAKAMLSQLSYIPSFLKWA